VPDTRELEYFAANWRQVLTSEGLYAFLNSSYNTSIPGSVILRSLNFKSWGDYAEAGLASPLIRSRETNLTVAGLAFVSDNSSDLLDTAFNRDHLRGFRLKADADWADRLLGINQVNLTYSQGLHVLGASDNNTGF